MKIALVLALILCFTVPACAEVSRPTLTDSPSLCGIGDVGYTAGMNDQFARTVLNEASDYINPANDIGHSHDAPAPRPGGLVLMVMGAVGFLGVCSRLRSR
ncbi:MAG: hypothetical protein ACYC08_05145 [Armatimonadota bacterium]